MSQLWRKFYYRLSLVGGILSLLLISTGAAADVSLLSEILKPKESFSSPVVLDCHKWLNLKPPLKNEIPFWCQASFKPEKEKSKIIF